MNTSGAAHTPSWGRPADAASTGQKTRPPARTGNALARELSMPLLLLGFAAYLTVQMLSMDVPDSVDFPGPRFFPALISGLIFLLTTVQLALSLRSWTSGELDAALTREQQETGTHFSWSSLAWVVGGFLGFALLLKLLGWVIAAGLLFWCVAFGFGHRRPLMNLIVGLTVSSCAYIAFDMALGLNLPSGLLGGGF